MGEKMSVNKWIKKLKKMFVKEMELEIVEMTINKHIKWKLIRPSDGAKAMVVTGTTPNKIGPGLFAKIRCQVRRELGKE